MEKTINCAECGVSYTYQEKEGFPRKYCANCSQAKKNSFAGVKTETITAEVNMETPKMVAVGNIQEAKPKMEGVHIVLDKPKKNGFDNTPMYVSYAKDIFMEIHDDEEDLGLTMDLAIKLVKQAKEGLQA